MFHISYRAHCHSPVSCGVTGVWAGQASHPTSVVWGFPTYAFSALCWVSLELCVPSEMQTIQKQFRGLISWGKYWGSWAEDELGTLSKELDPLYSRDNHLRRNWWYQARWTCYTKLLYQAPHSGAAQDCFSFCCPISGCWFPCFMVKTVVALGPALLGRMIKKPDPVLKQSLWVGHPPLPAPSCPAAKIGAVAAASSPEVLGSGLALWLRQPQFLLETYGGFRMKWWEPP